jgi:aminopeptidase N
VDNAQRVFANFDQPDLKATITLSATAPTGWNVFSNGVERTPGSPGRWEFATTPVLPTSLAVLIAGPWHTVRREHRGIGFALHCRRSLAEYLDKEAPEIFDITVACFDRYLELFDEPYPFDSYDQAFVPELNWGAMETPGCITFRDDFLYRSAVTEADRERRGVVIAHEMAHMWFGDLVTMRWWDDLWLSESFAEYMGFQVLSEATRFTSTWTAFSMITKPWGYDADQRPSTHPVAPEQADVADTETALANFDGVSYAKGASVLRQLVTWLGREAFLAGVNDFLTRHRFGVATLSDLLESLGAASGLDVREWARRWLRTVGVDTLACVRGPAGIRIGHPGLRPHRVEVGLYDRAIDAPERLVLRRRASVALDVGSRWTALELADGEPQPDFLLLNDGDLDYCKIRFDPASWVVLSEALGGIGDPLSRAVVWAAVRDMVRDGELPPAEYLSLAERHLPAEQDVAIVGAVIAFARGHIADRYLDPTQRRRAVTTIGDIARSILERPEGLALPGLRLAAVRGVIDCAVTLDDTGGLRACLAAGEVPGGPQLDADLRWRILLRLSVLGAVDADEIEQALADDTSGTGPESAARCRAALPRLAAKDAAWEIMFGSEPDRDLSTYLVAATAEGFWQPEQRALLASFVDRYFPAAAEVSARRGAAVADVVAGAGFPSHVVDEAIVREGESWLSNDGLTGALRRNLVDALDDMRRALRVRAPRR